MERRRSIPARAGEPSACRRDRHPVGLSPHGRGNPLATPSPHGRGNLERRRWGLSPHGRGNLSGLVPGAPELGSIPARAGEPTSGGRWGGQSGSIPARAGEPMSSFRLVRSRGVYPRTGGGTVYLVIDDGIEEGLSPHGRGNQHLEPYHVDGTGRTPRGPLPRRVYPRTGGGTCSAHAQGLSPHGRGNRGRLVDQRRGSIPARAGEPSSRRTELINSTGLSPHGRGNRHGSIPARAGEPRSEGVYPRTGGGTSATCYPRTGGGATGMGLSPHGRGNPVLTVVGGASLGVYPRTGGGTPTKQQTDNAQLLRNKCRVCVLTGS